MLKYTQEEIWSIFFMLGIIYFIGSFFIIFSLYQNLSLILLSYFDLRFTMFFSWIISASALYLFYLTYLFILKRYADRIGPEYKGYGMKYSSKALILATGLLGGVFLTDTFGFSNSMTIAREFRMAQVQNNEPTMMPPPISDRDRMRNIMLFSDAFDRILNHYVDEPDGQKLIEEAISGMLESLDPHSGFMNIEAFENLQIQTTGEFGGIGIEIVAEGDYILVVSPIDGTPADKAGIMAQDVITHVDGEHIKGYEVSKAVSLMRGKIGTEVVITVRRGGDENNVRDFTLVRDNIRLQPVRSSLKDGGIAYLRVTQFNARTSELIYEHIENLRKEGEITGLILDLRNNPGGLLDQAVYVADTFMEEGDIVRIRSRNGGDVGFSTNKGDVLDGLPLVVLINGGSASASEIVAGAVQDNNRGVVIGTRSFGKGSVQTIFPLSGNTALRLTTALYYTPGGRSIQAQGIEPDIIVQQTIPEDLIDTIPEVGEHLLERAIASEDEDVERSASSVYVPRDTGEDDQIKAAIEWIINNR